MVLFAQIGWFWPYALGFGTAVFIATVLWLLQLTLDLRLTRAEAERMAAMAQNDALHASAWALVEESRKRLRMRKQLNPQWFAPLSEEIPQLVRDIAAVYHPDSEDPLKAPKLSEFTRAVQLTAQDISEFLQGRRVGRLIDRSANSAWKTYEKGRAIAAKPKLRRAGTLANKLYRKVRPVIQVVRYKSPFTWAGLAVSNAATRTLQPAVIAIVGRRAIQLYSGELRLLDEEDIPEQEA